ncbi:MAG: hypothetical protein ACR2PL_11275 [Dehalococcoidia bacterium]
MAHQSRPGVCGKKSQRDRLIRLAQTHPAWTIGFEDEVWWSREALPARRTWRADDQPLRLVERTVAKTDPVPKALACSGLLLRWQEEDGQPHEEAWLRFVDGRPLSAITTQFLAWRRDRLAAAGKTALRLVWDNASWHRSSEVRNWIREHNRQVKTSEQGV